MTSNHCIRALSWFAVVSAISTAAFAQSHVYTGGQWLDGDGFTRREMYSVDGFFVAHRPPRVDRVIDLGGGYVVPPYGEAHNHNVEGPPERAVEMIARYLRDGIFYVKMPNNLPRMRAEVAKLINTPTSIDVAFANGGFTSPGGHPWGLVQRNLERGVFTDADAEGSFVHSVANASDLRSKWGRLMATQPDFVKVYLLYSAEEGSPKPPHVPPGWRGIDPVLLDEIVRRAHQAGLSVTAHVETATDFRHAVRAGVDEITHLPGFRLTPEMDLPDPDIFAIAAEDARRAAELGVVVVTTLGGTGEYLAQEADEPLRRRATELFVANLRTLRQAGVDVAIGTDSYSDTAAMEIDYLAGLGVFGAADLVRAWTQVTPRTIFPDRWIGRLAPGYEASFLVLGGNPLVSFPAVHDIRLRVKQGVVLDPLPPADSPAAATPPEARTLPSRPAINAAAGGRR